MPRSLRSSLPAFVLAASLAIGGTIAAAPAAHAAPSVLPLVVTEIVPNNVGDDNFEYFEVHNTTDAAITVGEGAYGFAYSRVDSADRTEDAALTANATIPAHGTVVFWLRYADTDGMPDAFARTFHDFRGNFGGGDYPLVEATGQLGMANGGGRGIRVVDAAGESVSWSYYGSGTTGEDLSARFGLPADGASRSMALIGSLATPTPGTPMLETAPPPSLDVLDLLITEISPDTVGTDYFEFFEVHNASGRTVDFGTDRVQLSYVNGATATPLSVPSGTALAAGETAAFWVRNDSSLPKSVDDFLAFYARPAGYNVISVTGQNGFANTGARTVQLASSGAIVSAASYSDENTDGGKSAHFRVPVDPASTTLDVLERLGTPTPGSILPDALVPAPLQPDPTVHTAPLQITEVTPDSTNVGNADGYEFIELFNATSAPIDFADYTLRYLYPNQDLTNASVALWPSTTRDVVIPAGGTLTFWIKNGPNQELTAEHFNSHWGTSLVPGENLVEITSAGMANGSARGLEIATNTGISINRAYYNLAGVDDVEANRGILYAANPETLGIQNRFGYAAGTPGSIDRAQVPGGLMIVAADAAAPTIADRSATEFSTETGVVIDAVVTDDVAVRTVTLELLNNVDGAPVLVNLVNDGAGTYRYTVPGVDATGKEWYEYRFLVSDGTNPVSTDPKRMTRLGGTPEPVRLGLRDDEYVTGTRTFSAASGAYPSDLSLTLDGAALVGYPELESSPVFAFEASGVDTFFKNGVLLGDEVLSIFQEGIYEGSKTIPTAVPLSAVNPGESLVLRVYTGTKAAPEIDLNENNDDFTIRDLRLVLPDGRTLRPEGYEDATRVLAIGDSVNANGAPTGKLDYVEARFTVPADAFSAIAVDWDTTTVADGAHEVTASGLAGTASVTVTVDNTRPVIAPNLEAGRLYQGEFMIDADATDAGAGIASLVASLDGEPIELPHATASITLPDGEHTAVFTATDLVGNVAEHRVVFSTPVEEPGNELMSPVDGAQVEVGEIDLTARAVDPSGDRLDVTFARGYELTPGDGVTAYAGETTDAAETARDGRRVLTREQLAEIAVLDQSAAEITSATLLPYQLFEVAVPEEAGDDYRVRLRWDGVANPDAKVLMYVLDPASASWTEVDRHLTTDGAPTAFTLGADVDAALAVDGTITVLVQHSEGFAGGDRSARDAVVEPAHPDDTARSAYDFTIGWETDTQYYNENFYQHQQAINRYFLDRRDALNLQYVMHTGDIVNQSEQLSQWQNADAAYRAFDEAGLPYGVLAGNHDVGHLANDYTAYSQWFGEARYADNPWYGGSYLDNRGHYDLVSAGGIDFILLSMGWGPGDAEIAWMNEVLARYPERVAILEQHEFILTTGGLGEIPQRILDEVVATNPNVAMVVSGHYHDAYTRIDGFDDNGDGVEDRQVYSMLFDYQGLPEGGLGYLRLLHFDNQAGKVQVRTYSPSLQDYDSDDASYTIADQEFQIPYAAAGIAAREKQLGTDAFRAEVFTTEVIDEFSDVESGTELTTTWAPGPGSHAWYVVSSDPHGGVSYSEVRSFVLDEPEVEEPGEDPVDENPGEPGGEHPAKPTTPSVPVPTAALDPGLAGGIDAPDTARVGDPITIDVGTEHAGAWVQLWLHSTPTALGGWTQVGADGRVHAVIPAGMPVGEHTLVAQGAAGEVLGWTPIRIEALPAPAIVPAAVTPGSLPATGIDPVPLGALAALALTAGLLLLAIRVRLSRRRA